MKKTLKILLTVGVIGVIILLLFMAKSYSQQPQNETEKAENILVQKCIHMLPHEEPTVTVRLKKKVKLELTATVEEFKHYFSNGEFIANETTNHIVIIGEEMGNDTTLKWTIYY